MNATAIVGMIAFFALGFQIGRLFGYREMKPIIDTYKTALHAWQNRAMKEQLEEE